MPSPFTTSSTDWYVFWASSSRSSISGVTLSWSPSILWNHLNSARRDMAAGDSLLGSITLPSFSSASPKMLTREQLCFNTFASA